MCLVPVSPLPECRLLEVRKLILVTTVTPVLPKQKQCQSYSICSINICLVELQFVSSVAINNITSDHFLVSHELSVAPKTERWRWHLITRNWALLPVTAQPSVSMCPSGRLMLLNERPAWLAILSLPLPSCGLRYSLNSCGSVPALKSSYFITWQSQDLRALCVKQEHLSRRK